MKRISLISSALFVFILVLTMPVSACSVCFAPTADNAMNTALQYGILSLLFVLLLVAGLLTRFFFSFQKRSKQLT